MMPHHSADDSGYSPPIRIELHLHGERFNVASVNSTRAILRDPRPVHAGVGLVRIDVDGSLADYQVDLFKGIDPERDEQPFVLIGVKSEVAA